MAGEDERRREKRMRVVGMTVVGMAMEGEGLSYQSDLRKGQ